MKSATIDEHAAGMALAVVFGAWFVICIAAYYVFQSPWMGLGQSMMHGVTLQVPVFSLTSVVTGLIAWLIFAYISGYGFAKLYNSWMK